MGQRKFGSIRTIKRRHATYYEASYPNPIVGTKPTRYYSTFDHTLDGYAQATAWLKEQHALITVDKWIPPQTQKKLRHIPTLETYAKEWLHTRTRKDGTRLKETTRQKHWQHLTNHVLPTLGSIPIDEITTSMVLNWYTTYPPEHGLRTRHTCYTLLKAIMDTASTAPLDDRGTTLIDSNPCTFASNSPRVAHEPHIASVDELYTLSQNMGDKLALTVLIAGICGLREGEICGLQRCDIDTRKRTIKVRRAISQR